MFMKIKDYLKKSPIFTIFQAHKTLIDEMNAMLTNENVNYLQALILVALLMEKNKEPSPQKLKETFTCSKATISQALSYLEKDELLKRRIHQKDARKISLSLTHKGILKANRLIKLIDNLEKRIENNFPASKLQGTLHSIEDIGRYISLPH